MRQRMVALLLFSALAAIPGLAQEPPRRLDLGPGITIRQAYGRPDRLGLDLDLRYERGREGTTTGDARWTTLALKGFQTFDRSVRDVDFMAAEFSVQGQHFRRRGLTEEERRRLAELQQLPESALSEADADSIGAMVARAAHARFALVYQLHYRFETTQQVGDNQNAFGASLVTELPLLHSVLDLVPEITRLESGAPGPSPYRPQPVRLGLSADYLTGAGETAIGTAGAVTRLWRFEAQAVWSTVVLDSMQLGADWRAQVFLDAPGGVIAADRRFNSFVKAWLSRRVAGQTDVVVEYVDGRIQPNYDPVSAAAFGMRVALPALR